MHLFFYKCAPYPLLSFHINRNCLAIDKHNLQQINGMLRVSCETKNADFNMLGHGQILHFKSLFKSGVIFLCLRTAPQFYGLFGSKDSFELNPINRPRAGSTQQCQNDQNSQQFHKIFQQYLTLEMFGKQNQIKRNQDTSALIAQEWQLVLSGKSAEQLVEIIQNYELDLLTAPIEHNQELLQIYVWALLAAGNYLQLKFLITRYQKLFQKTPLTALAQAGAAQNLQSLCKSFREYIKVFQDQQLITRLSEATLKAVLNILSKYFITYSSSQIMNWLGCKQQDFRHLGYTVDGGFVELKKEQKTSECLMNKLKQLAIVANRMSKFE